MAAQSLSLALAIACSGYLNSLKHLLGYGAEVLIGMIPCSILQDSEKSKEMGVIKYERRLQSAKFSPESRLEMASD